MATGTERAPIADLTSKDYWAVQDKLRAAVEATSYDQWPYKLTRDPEMVSRYYVSFDGITLGWVTRKGRKWTAHHSLEDDRYTGVRMGGEFTSRRLAAYAVVQHHSSHGLGRRVYVLPSGSL